MTYMLWFPSLGCSIEWPQRPQNCFRLNDRALGGMLALPECLSSILSEI
nr:MAG TPA: hypothetical protein [Caudoviricetes sp.]